MSRSWNGKAFVDELADFLGDSSDSFKKRILGWTNDVIFDVSSRHDWGHHLVKGKKLLDEGEEVQLLEVQPPVACKVARGMGGELSANAKYTFLLTYVQNSGVETMAGEYSDAVTTTEDEKTIALSEIPTSCETYVSKRRLYVKKNDGEFFLHSEIDDNSTSNFVVKEEKESVVQPPDYESIRKLKGSPYFEGGSANYLSYRDLDQLRLWVQGTWSVGNPEFFSYLSPNQITTYPIAGEDKELSFSYYRSPHKLYYSTDSQPDLPIYLKQTLKAGVIAFGYEFREREGAEIKRANYDNSLVDAINRGARLANIEYSVRDVYGNFNGVEVG